MLMVHTRNARPRGRRLCAGFVCVALVLGLLPACATTFPKPPTGRIPPDAMIEVPYPPPPAHVDTVPPQKNDSDVWIDGQWNWDGTEWKWAAGVWVTPPPDAYFTSWKTERRKDGQLLFARAAWRDRNGRPLDFGAGLPDCDVPPVRRGGEVAKR